MFLSTLLCVKIRMITWWDFPPLLILFIIINFGVRGLWWVIALLLTAACADIISGQIIKPLVMRIRPCQDIVIGPQLRFFIKYCPGNYSFTSSHAASYFAQAMFLHLTLKTIWRYSLVFFLWAFLISYTQVYVGVHYPFDVLCGGILGCGIGVAISKMYLKQAGMLSLVK
ncbi:MAG: phosphatase PAP2 family protein [Chitinophagaceae bacterium]|nr:MAG: phosphatase PAP2 family protein [Chitinophagaceae bacterium]